MNGQMNRRTFLKLIGPASFGLALFPSSLTDADVEEAIGELLPSQDQEAITPQNLRDALKLAMRGR